MCSKNERQTKWRKVAKHDLFQNPKLKHLYALYLIRIPVNMLDLQDTLSCKITTRTCAAAVVKKTLPSLINKETTPPVFTETMLSVALRLFSR